MYIYVRIMNFKKNIYKPKKKNILIYDFNKIWGEILPFPPLVQSFNEFLVIL